MTRRELRVELGVCRNCGNGKSPYKTMCDECHAAYNARSKERRAANPRTCSYAKYTAKYRATLRELGVCIGCRKASVKFIRCLDCRMIRNRDRREHRLWLRTVVA
jgi:hypothetical protein